MANCGARTRSGTPCQRPAGWGTDHKGEGRCKWHGGASPGAPKGNRYALKHGTYESVIRDRLTEQEQAVFDAVPADEDLRQELRVLRFKLLRLLDPIERQAVVGTKDGAEIVTLEVDEVTKAYAIERLTDGIRKIVKELHGASADDPLLEFAEAITRARRRRTHEDDEE